MTDTGQTVVELLNKHFSRGVIFACFRIFVKALVGAADLGKVYGANSERSRLRSRQARFRAAFGVIPSFAAASR